MLRLEEFKQELLVKDSSVVSKELQGYCIEWLTNHIRVTDVELFL